MGRPEPLSDDEILNYLHRAAKPASLRQIASALGLRHAARRALAKSIARLKRRKLIEEARGGCYRLTGGKVAAGEERPRRQPAGEEGAALSRDGGARRDRDPDVLTGRLVAHHDGYGFVVPETPRPDLEGDLFIPPDQSADAMHGDRVIARIERRSGRTEGRAEGRILRVLGRAHPTVVGVFRYGARGNVVLPYEARLHEEIVIPPGDELTPELLAKHGAPPNRTARLSELDGAVVNVELTRFPRSGVPAAGRVIEVLGRPGDFGVDVEILIRKHHLPHRFSEEVLEEARRVAQPDGDSAALLVSPTLLGKSGATFGNCPS